jgi:hypothetical protein
VTRRFRKETRWKVRTAWVAGLQAKLQKLTNEGWTIHSLHSHGLRFTVIASRQVRVKS